MGLGFRVLGWLGSCGLGFRDLGLFRGFRVLESRGSGV